MKRFCFFLFFLIASQLGAAWAQGIQIKGNVVDASSNHAIPFANIQVVGTSSGATGDLDGNFEISNLNPGFIKLLASSVGYENTVSEEVMLTRSKSVFITIRMNPKNVQLEGVEVKSSIFKRIDESPVSMRSIGLSQVEKVPGANRDISKVIQILPGVSSSVSFRNDIIVRGGGPAENRFYLDGMEIPNLNHFATQGASGGPVGIINTDFLQEVDFYSGAFPASKGNALSSILDMRLIDANKERLVYKAALGASETSLSINGPVSEHTGLLFSVRRSYLQFLFNAIGLPFLPTFNDYSLKLKYKPDVHNEFTFITIGALDVMKLNTGIKNPTDAQQYILDYLPVNKQWNYTIGGIYKHYRTHSYYTIIGSRNMLWNSQVKYKDNDQSSGNKLLDYESAETENKIRYESVSRFRGFKWVYGAGGEYAKYSNKTSKQVFIPTATDTIMNLGYQSGLELFKWSVYGQLSKSMMDDRITASLGLRSDANTFSEKMSNPLTQLSPRFSLSYDFTPKISISGNLGRYYQLPAYTTLGYKDAAGNYVNKQNQLSYIGSNHFVLGAEYRRNVSSRHSIEFFYKQYDHYPFSLTDSVSLASKGADYGVAGDEAVSSTNRGRALGFELYYREKFGDKADATFSYTFVRSSFQDKKGEYIPSSWDNRHILNITVQYNFKRNFDAGLKWRLVGGAPYTPYNLALSSNKAAWDVRGQGYLDYSQFNALRLKAFHQLDLRVEKQFFFKKWLLAIYLDVQNVYNNKNVLPDYLVLSRDANGEPLSDPTDSSKYVLNTISADSGTVLPTIPDF